MGLLAALVALVCICTPECGAEACSGFRHLENGRTFFRYGGLLVTFRCHAGYQLHGYKTNSCVSGHWSRDPPVCVGSGCSSPGPLTHGTSSVNADGSWVLFSCDSGFQLRGPSMLYCKGHTWNSTKPACKEYDMMSSVSGVSRQKPNFHQNLQDSIVLKMERNIFSNTASKEANPKVGLLTYTSSQMSNNDRVKVTNPVHLHQHPQFPGFKMKDGHQTTHDAQLQLANERPGPWTLRHHSEAVITITAVTNPTTSVHQPKNSDLPLLDSEKDKDETGFQYLPSPLPQAPASSSSSGTFPVATLANSRSTESSMTTQLPHVIPPLKTPNTTGHRSLSTDTTSEPPLSLLLSRRRVCPYPPVPVHGTFNFRSIENPSPEEYRHYVQYACYPGYTLAHGDVHSYCLQGTWSGVTPVCLELTPCSVNNGGCSQLCSYNYGSNQTETRAQCYCRPGFILLDDGRTCRDVDECTETQRPCRHRCINTFGSFKCGCDDGYQAAHDQASCADVDECLLPVAVTGCVFGCVNTPGSFYCQCPSGYSLQSPDGHCQDIDECAANQGLGPCVEHCHNLPGSYRCSCTYGRILAGDGHSCIAECPSGYRKQTTLPPENSTAQALKEECVDVNECQEDICDWQCVNLPGSHRCICPRGYTLQTDGRRCKDIDECSQRNGGCSHLCVNQKGAYKCACPASHRLSSYSWKKCVPRTLANAAGRGGHHQA